MTWQPPTRRMTPELQALRHAVEHDRYGLMAHVLAVRDHCTPSDCAAFRALTDQRQIVANMDERVYDGLISRYAPTWNARRRATPVAALVPGVPTGKPTNADFPSAASTPPVSIMTPEPGVATTSSRRARPRRPQMHHRPRHVRHRRRHPRWRRQRSRRCRNPRARPRRFRSHHRPLLLRPPQPRMIDPFKSQR